MRFLAGLVLLAACGHSAPAEAPKVPVETERATAGPSTSSGHTSAPSSASVPTVDEIWKRVATDLTACYETGRKAVPEMIDGRIAFVTAVDASGQTTCVVPNDDTGLTAEVEDCMRLRLERETYPAVGTAWSTRVPVIVKGGKVSLGGPTMQTSIDTVESRGLSEDLYSVIDDLMPDVKDCVRGTGKSVVVVGARVAKDGAVACAVASSTSHVPDEARGCLAKVFGRAHFKAPKKGTGLLSVPIEITK